MIRIASGRLLLYYSGMKKCLLCRNSMEEDQHGFFTGGTLYANFGYHSRFDDCPGLPPPGVNVTPPERLSMCREVVAYICNDCFEKNYELFEGYDIIFTRPKRVLEFTGGELLDKEQLSS